MSPGSFHIITSCKVSCGDGCVVASWNQTFPPGHPTTPTDVFVAVKTPDCAMVAHVVPPCTRTDQFVWFQLWAIATANVGITRTSFHQ